LTAKYASTSSILISESGRFKRRYQARNRRTHPDQVLIEEGDKPRSCSKQDLKSANKSANCAAGSSYGRTLPSHSFAARSIVSAVIGSLADASIRLAVTDSRQPISFIVSGHRPSSGRRLRYASRSAQTARRRRSLLQPGTHAFKIESPLLGGGRPVPKYSGQYPNTYV
jgi:hypothetical protein